MGVGASVYVSGNQTWTRKAASFTPNPIMSAATITAIHACGICDAFALTVS